ncbi:MAG: hypothetical protein R3C01_10595 [Planctomycetaceae bacterium]
MLISPSTLLAADPGGIVGIIFFVIAIIGWISNFISGQKEAADRKQRQKANPRVARNRDAKVQEELDAFLKEATGEQQTWRNKAVPIEVSLDDIEVIETPTRKPPAARQQPQQQKAKPTPQAQRKPQSTRTPNPVSRTAPGAPSGPRPVSAIQLTGSASHLASNVNQHVEEHLKRQVSQSVHEHLGDFTATGKNSVTGSGQLDTRYHRPSPGTIMMQKIRSEYGMRAAVVMSEILSPPVSRKRGDMGNRPS